ncbi:MAG TPA: tRNA (adenosine(37)-N6)-dimethylallyltransferase MiaA [Methylophaga sp.]|nr:tRNA (adenosine(37)-N6)-dimethylallyltransferase MiaA [Methylophaga sp.]
MGPTASGKTDLALNIARELPVEIISVDSALVYRDMDIGTAKPSLTERQQVPHHLIDIIEPCEIYSVGQFREDASRLMAEITSRNRIPLLVGGTMLYFNSLQRGLADLPAANAVIRQRLDQEAAEHGLAYMHQRLQKIDPESAARIRHTDPQRLQRALEIYELTGTPMSQLIAKTQPDLPYQMINIVLAPFQRKILHSRIAARYQQMMANGFLDEVRKLVVRGDCHENLPAIRAVGYRQAWAHLHGEYDEATFIDKAIIATRQMAKRQITWLRAQQDATWFDSGPSLPVSAVMQYLQQKLRADDKA